MTNRIFSRGSSTKFFKYILVLIIIITGIVVLRSVFTKSETPSSLASDKLQIKDALYRQDLNRDVKVPISGSIDEEVEPVNMKIENIELRDEIIVQGQKASSVAGRAFFVVNLKLINPLKQGVEINTKDYMRLAEGDKAEWLAPDIHNDPVLVQAISTKPTRLAFPVSSDTRNFKLQVGEISGEKEQIEINF